jgi:hypothetical protein
VELTVESVFREPELLCQETARAESLGSKALTLALQATAGGALYGLTMGMNHSIEQALVSAVKVPLLFLLTLAICLPALHFVGLLLGARVRLGQSLTLLLAGVSLTCTLLAAFTPISLLFLASGSTYPFLLAMHVALFAGCGAAGLRSIHQNFERLRAAAGQGAAAGGAPLSVAGLKAWGALYMFVGAQTAFLLSPFIARDAEFHLFNPHHGSVFGYLLSVLWP